jgi:hypothetical protein
VKLERGGARGRGCSLDRPTRARGERGKRARLGSAQQREGEEQASSGGLLGHRATGKKVSFIFFSYMIFFSKAIFKMNFEFKSNKTKTTPLNKTNATA